MAMHEASIKLTPHCGPGTEIVIDGHDIHGVRELTLSASGGEMPRLSLDLRLGHVAASGPMRVEIDEQTAQALKALGWTPPPQDVEVTRLGQAEPEYIPGGPA